MSQSREVLADEVGLVLVFRPSKEELMSESEPVQNPGWDQTEEHFAGSDWNDDESAWIWIWLGLRRRKNQDEGEWDLESEEETFTKSRLDWISQVKI